MQLFYNTRVYDLPVSSASLPHSGSQELVFSFHLLLCCVDYVARLTPSFLLRPPFGRLFDKFKKCCSSLIFKQK